MSEAIYVGDSITKDIYMAGLAGVTSVWVNYPKIKNNYYNMLVDITSWTEEDFDMEKLIKQEYERNKMKPDYTICNFKDLLEIFREVKS